MLGFKNFIEASSLHWARKPIPTTPEPEEDLPIIEPDEEESDISFHFPPEIEKKSREEEEILAARKRAEEQAAKDAAEEAAELQAAKKEKRKPRTKAEREALKRSIAQRAEAEKYSKNKAWPPPSFMVKQAEPFGTTEEVPDVYDTAFHPDDMKSISPTEKMQIRKMWNQSKGRSTQRIADIALSLGMPIAKVKRVIYGSEPQIDPEKFKQLQKSRTPNWKKLVDKYGLTPEQAWYYLRKKGRVQSGVKRENTEFVTFSEWLKEIC